MPAPTPDPTEVRLDRACPGHQWQIELRGDDGALLGRLSADDAELWPLLADRVLGAVTPLGTVTYVELRQDGVVVERRVYVRVSRPAPRPQKTRL
jgi:hypothetical protein